ncbi:MAG: TldD/PmbA family protein [Thermoplasmata archaeon]
MEEMLDSILDYCGKRSSFADVRFMSSEENGVSYRNGEFQGFQTSRNSGIAIRIVNRSISYVFTNSSDRDEIFRLIDGAVDRSNKPGKNRISPGNATRTKWKVPASRTPLDMSIDDRIDIVKENDELMKTLGADIRINVLSDSVTHEHYMNTIGSSIEGEFPRIGYSYVAGVMDSGNFEQSSAQFGITAGYEDFKTMKIQDKVAGDIKSLKNAIRSRGIKPGVYDVVIGPEISGIVAHESCGHPTEYDRIIGREGAQAGESFLSGKTYPYRIGSESVSVIDDPTMPKSYGFYRYDDEGIESRKKYLYHHGMTEEFIHNRESAAILGVKPNGCGRSSDWDMEPIPRMSTTYIEPGEFTLEELIEGIKDGLYIVSYTEWNIDDIRYNEKYVGKEAYRITDGKLGGSVRRPVIETTTTKLYGSVDAVSRDLEFSAGTCGKGDPEQGVDVWMGGPNVRLRNMYIS